MEFLNQDPGCKTHVLGFAEANIGAIYHATQTVLELLDRSLDIFLRDFQLDARSALWSIIWRH